MSGKTGKIILGVIGLLFLLAGAGVGIYLVQQQQLIQKEAVVPGGTADIFLTPATSNPSAGSSFDVNVVMNSHGETVSTFNVRLTLPDDGIVTVNDVLPNTSLVQDHQWRYDTLNHSVSGGNIVIDIGAFNTSIEGYAPSGDFTVATIQFNAAQAGTATLQFDPANTILLSKGTGNDILSDQLPVPAGNYAVGGGTPPTNTPVPQPTSPPAPTNTPIPGQPTNTPAPPTNTPAPTATTPPGQPTNTPAPTAATVGGVCNLSCTSDSGCTGGFVCEAGQCRNSSCRGETDCDCSVTDSGTTIAITSPVNGSQLTDTTPTFTGTAAPGARITITVNSASPITGTVTADSSGNWTWTVPSSTPLTLGSHTGTFVAYDLEDRQTTATVSFSIVASGTTTTTTTTTDPNLPQAGSVELTLLLSALGVLFLVSGGLLALKRR